MEKKFRLIIDGEQGAAFNMAADEFLMEAMTQNTSRPTLRFYSWSEPSISIGYFQNVDEVARRFHSAEKKITVIRRLSGGGLVCHGKDLTFSLAIQSPNHFLPSAARESYLAVHELLRHALLPMYSGLDYARCADTLSPRGKANRVCFEEPSCHDLLLDGQKVIVASQRRKGAVLLHQSAIFLPGERKTLIDRIVREFQRKWGIEFEQDAWNSQETQIILKTAKDRYCSREWIYPA